MSDLQAAILRWGNSWSLQTNDEMQALYEPLHAARSNLFSKSVLVTKALKYGSHARHRIDVYRPGIIDTSNTSLPVVVFFHGGGFMIGDNDITPSMYGNIGNYFASNGCICVLATYRLLPEARYPSGANDTSQALQWVNENISSFGGDASQVTAIGQSSGGAHLASALFLGKLKHLKLHGIILLSAPLWYDLRQERRRANMLQYHGTESEEEVLTKTAVAVFQASEDIDPTELRIMLAEYDPEEQVDGNLMFVEAYRNKFKRLPLAEVMKGHNHISYTLGLGLEGDVVGPRILSFALF